MIHYPKASKNLTIGEDQKYRTVCHIDKL